ncbi:hypothetical protein [Mesorhizobium sp. M1B.F.Ca.ET.045.04.1.1]|uniref:hypothetical protein n=1 Tax=Mesorhizobium sp. M1B.F.Ca.ET.045.04.1.1 TaxID=2493673 RepID=UPI000F75CC78|nr:hypothetical protein [Mesorhizobium sp. M1B.F.Ca.ET.045.04.1.1]AZO29679.1 hypothetical protein EJ071_21235 [Mesorhizobium sp. M1B.F.Ca.ET.045.04.1.1]
MGVAIHFEGQLPGEREYAALLQEVEAFAVIRGWPVRKIEEVEMALTRMIDEREVDYVGQVTGIKVLPHPRSDPLRFEFDRNLFMQQYCKTQFAGSDTHIEVIELLCKVAPLFDKFDVFDEGGYWESRDRSILQRNLDTVEAMIFEAMHKDPSARGPLRLESGRVVDFVSDPQPGGE